MEQLLIVINNKSVAKPVFYATEQGVDATGLDKVDFLMVKKDNGEVIKIDRDDVTQWWERDTETGNILMLQDGEKPVFANAEDASKTKVDDYFKEACSDFISGTIQPLNEFECEPTSKENEVGTDNKVVPLIDPHELKEQMDFDAEELGEIDDFKHSGVYSAYYFVCWTNRKDFENALPAPHRDSNGVKSIDTDKIDTSCAMFLKPMDFYYLNEKNKIYAYLEKSVDLNVPRQERQRFERHQ